MLDIFYNLIGHSNELIFAVQMIVLLLSVYASSSLGRSSLVTCLCVQSILANIMVLKKIYLFGLDVTGSDAFAVASILCINVLREKYDSKSTQEGMYACWLWMVLSALLFQLHINFIPSASDVMHTHYLALFSPLSHLIFESLCIIIVIQYIDYFLFSFFKYFKGHWSFQWRSIVSLLISQALDTALFTYVLSLQIPLIYWDVFLWSYALKCAVILFLSVGSFLLTHKYFEKQYVFNF